jgi:hypothetical protein
MDESGLNKGQSSLEAFLGSRRQQDRRRAEAEIADYNIPIARKNLDDFNNVLWCIRNLEKNCGDEKNIDEARHLISVVYRKNLTYKLDDTKCWVAI